MEWDTAEEAVAAIVTELIEDGDTETPVYVHEDVPGEHLDEDTCWCNLVRVW